MAPININISENISVSDSVYENENENENENMIREINLDANNNETLPLPFSMSDIRAENIESSLTNNDTRNIVGSPRDRLLSASASFYSISSSSTIIEHFVEKDENTTVDGCLYFIDDKDSEGDGSSLASLPAVKYKAAFVLDSSSEDDE